jgi:hypothetical protein
MNGIADGLISYTVPQGTKNDERWDFRDHTYDGQLDRQCLRNGLGKLTDGRVGSNDFQDDFNLVLNRELRARQKRNSIWGKPVIKFDFF